MKQLHPFTAGFLQAAGVVLYVLLFASVINVLQHFEPSGPLVAVPLFLLTFSLSALVCGLLALGYPIYLIVKQKKWKEAFQVLGYMAAWMAVALVLLGITFFHASLFLLKY